MKFKCKKCSCCCRKFGGGDGAKEPHLPIFEWEVEIIKKIAKERGINLDIRPSDVFLDKKSDTAFCCMYGLFNEPCNFLKENKCSIYEKRPLVCRMFPLFCTPEFAANGFNLGCFWKCQNFNNAALIEYLKGKTKGESIKELKKIYGNSYENCFKGSFIRREIEERIIRYSRENLIDLVKLEPKEYEKYKIIPFFGFLVKRNIIDEDQKKILILKFLGS
jgi:Fe-S-cluster containining protein